VSGKPKHNSDNTKKYGDYEGFIKCNVRKGIQSTVTTRMWNSET